MAQYKALTGIEYLGKRAEAGDIVSDLPNRSIKWLRECGAIEPVGAEPEPEPEPVVEEAAPEADAIAEDGE